MDKKIADGYCDATSPASVYEFLDVGIMAAQSATLTEKKTIRGITTEPWNKFMSKLKQNYNYCKVLVIKLKLCGNAKWKK